jgi:hypothetical protein
VNAEPGGHTGRKEQTMALAEAEALRESLAQRGYETDICSDKYSSNPTTYHLHTRMDDGWVELHTTSEARALLHQGPVS